MRLPLFAVCPYEKRADAAVRVRVGSDIDVRIAVVVRISEIGRRRHRY